MKHKICVWIFSTNFSERFLNLRRIERDIIINVLGLHAKFPLFLWDFNEKLS